MKVLIVDDSSVFRTQIKSALRKSGIEVAASASNGRDAISILKSTPVDVMTLDLEMPEMNGLETLQALRDLDIQVKVIVFAAQTSRGAATTFDAMRLGAVDVVTKPQVQGGGLEESVKMIQADLVPKILQFSGQRKVVPNPPKTINPALSEPKTPNVDKPATAFKRKELSTFRPEIIVIGSSTGGPVALEQLLTGVPLPSVPICIAQHMPPMFTKTLASRLQDVTKVPCHEAVNGARLLPGQIYIAPGDFHLKIYKNNNEHHLLLNSGPKRNSVRPAVDFLFETAAEFFGPKVMGFVLTGMGEDGKDGCIAIKKAEGGVMIQDKESSVVWGMPGAVHGVGAFDRMGSLEDLRLQMIDLLKRQMAA